MRVIWKGSISFGLVNIPVGLYSVTKPQSKMKFQLCRDTDLSPIKYQRIAETSGEEVSPDHIVKRFESDNGTVILTEDDFGTVALPVAQVIDIKKFVDPSEITPTFFDKLYYIAPQRGGEKAYALLCETLKKTGKVGITKTGMRKRERLAAVRPDGEALLLELMHFADALCDRAELNLPVSDLTKKELAMAEGLVQKMSGRWKPDEFKDEYRKALMELIEKKIVTGQLPGKKAAKPTRPADIQVLLQASLDKAARKKSASGR